MTTTPAPAAPAEAHNREQDLRARMLARYPHLQESAADLLAALRVAQRELLELARRHPVSAPVLLQVQLAITQAERDAVTVS